MGIGLAREGGVVGIKTYPEMNEKTLGAWGCWDDCGPYFIEAVCSLGEAKAELESLIEDVGPDGIYEVNPVRRNAVVMLIHEHEMYCGCPERIAKTVYEFWLEDKEEEVIGDET